MEDFTFYFSLGWRHILNTGGLDHLLFILVLTCAYEPKEWKKVLMLVTAFTVGHSITLALCAFNIIKIKSSLVEFLIPCTIICSSVFNLVKTESRNYIRINYFIALFFGLIHGMGFANSIRFMLASDQNIIFPLAGFNIGLEAGQILFIFFTLAISLFVKKIQINFRWWTIIISTIVLLSAIWMVADRWILLNNNR